MPETRICTGAPEDNIASRGAGRARRMPPHSPPRGPSPHSRRTTAWRPRTVREAATRISRKVDADIPTAVAAVPAPAPAVDQESREWLRCLRATGEARDDAVRRLHALLLKAARFEVGRRRRRSPPAGERARRDRARGCGRRVDERACTPRRFPRVEPLHHLGVQVRLARGSGETASTCLAGAGGAARAGVVGSVRQCRVDA